mmetsp:Transcript_24109/g.69592  ORF Transcript_24109/g.69592 Transcript_24109/m.69592 type:complete len:223 (+) Transcript_24109:166-834(+)
MSQTSRYGLPAIELVWAKATAAAVGHFTRSRTLSLAALQAWTSAFRWFLPNWAGTVTTASTAIVPRYLSAILRRCSTSSVTISSGGSSLSLPRSRTWIIGRSPSPGTTFEGQVLIYHCTQGFSNLQPRRRCGAKIVFSRFVSACSWAASPTRTHWSVKATTLGVASLPRPLGITVTSPSRQRPTREKQVPRSMPMHTGGPAASVRVRMAKPMAAELPCGDRG